MKLKLLSLILCVAVLVSFFSTESTEVSGSGETSDAAASLVVNILNPDGTTTLVHEYAGEPVYAEDGSTILYYTYPELESLASISYFATIDAMPAAVGTKARGVTLNDLVTNAQQYNSDVTWASGQKIVLYATDSPSNPYQGNNYYTFDLIQGQERYYYPNLVEKYTAYRDNGEDTYYLDGWNENATLVEPVLCLSSFQERYATDAMLKDTEAHTYTFGVEGSADYREITTPVTLDGIESLRFCMGLTASEAANGVAGTYSSTNKFCQWVFRLDFGPVNGPSLYADTSDNLVGQPITITYTDNEDWRKAVTGVTIDGVLLDSSSYTLAAGSLTLDSGTFTSSGSYSVSVSATGYMNSKVTQKIGVGAPTAGFTADVRNGTVPLTVNFTDQSTGDPSAWAWDFDNDGTVDSEIQNPAWTYTTTGSFTVKLTATNAAGADDETKTDYVTVTTSEVTPWDGTSFNTDWSGAGTPEDPFLILNGAQLKGLANMVDNSTTYSGISFKLGSDINLGDYVWTPIGGHCSLPYSEEGWPSGNYFAGTFDGDNHTISGINVSNPVADTGAYGLFGYVEGGLIANLNVAGSLDMGDNAVSMIGSVVGYTTGSLYNLHSSMTVYTGDPTYTTASQAGGIAGAIRNTSSTQKLYIRYCSNSGTVTARGRIGGIVGAVYSVSDGGVVVDQCYNTGNITSVYSQMKIFTGGIVGYCRGYITNCYNRGEMTTNNGHYLAGLVGILQGANPVASMSNCYSTAVFHNYATGWDRWLWGSADRSAYVHITNCFWLPNDANSDITQPNEDDSWGTQTFVSSITDAELRGTVEMTESNRSGTFSGYVVDNYLGAEDLDNLYGTFGFTYTAADPYPILAWQLIPDFKVDPVNPAVPQNTYTVTVSSGSNGSASVDQGTVGEGDSAVITILPDEGYHLATIKDNSTSVLDLVIDNIYVIENITANHTVIVTFTNDTYVLSYSAGAHGSISGTTSQTVDRGASGTAVSAVAESGYHFAMWSDYTTSNPRTDTSVTADLSVKAIFIIDAAGVTPSDYFTLAVIPDTQYYAESAPEIFDQQIQWIADNAGSENIVFAAHLGDLVDDYNDEAQWLNARDSMAILRASGIPYSVVPGNHDYDYLTSDLSYFDNWFPAADFTGYDWYGGHYPENSNTNSYQLFSALGQDFVLLNLASAPSLVAESTSWANEVLDYYSSRKAIIVTHGYIDDCGNLLDSSSISGAAIHDNITLTHGNVFAVMCGHYSGQYCGTETGAAGNNLYNLLTDYQDETNGGNGWLRLYRFYPSENKISAVTYSPYLDQYDTSISGQFDLSLYMNYLAGDVNGDQSVNILDIVKTVNFIMDRVTPNTTEFAAADYNQDGSIDILDVVQIVNCILKGM